jgi:hypothetical protein
MLQSWDPDCPEWAYSLHTTLSLKFFLSCTVCPPYKYKGYNIMFFFYPGWSGCKLFAAVTIFTVNVEPLLVQIFCCAVINFTSQHDTFTYDD